MREEDRLKIKTQKRSTSFNNQIQESMVKVKFLITKVDFFVTLQPIQKLFLKLKEMSASILESSKSNNYPHTEGTSLLAKQNSAQNAQIGSSSINFLNDAKTFVIENFLLVSFSVALLLALIYPSAGKLVHSWSVGSFVVMELLNYLIVFFISGFTLKLEELKAVMKHRIPIAYSLIAINVVTTFLGFILIRFPYLINEFQIGETIFACVPTTLGEFFFTTSRRPVN
jgi:hypothetical protein